jgi:hypothetical protein
VLRAGQASLTRGTRRSTPASYAYRIVHGVCVGATPPTILVQSARLVASQLPDRVPRACLRAGHPRREARRPVRRRRTPEGDQPWYEDTVVASRHARRRTPREAHAVGGQPRPARLDGSLAERGFLPAMLIPTKPIGSIPRSASLLSAMGDTSTSRETAFAKIRARVQGRARLRGAPALDLGNDVNRGRRTSGTP